MPDNKAYLVYSVDRVYVAVCEVSFERETAQMYHGTKFVRDILNRVHFVSTRLDKRNTFESLPEAMRYIIGRSEQRVEYYRGEIAKEQRLQLVCAGIVQ